MCTCAVPARFMRSDDALALRVRIRPKSQLRNGQLAQLGISSNQDGNHSHHHGTKRSDIQHLNDTTSSHSSYLCAAKAMRETTAENENDSIDTSSEDYCLNLPIEPTRVSPAPAGVATGGREDTPLGEVSADELSKPPGLPARLPSPLLLLCALLVLFSEASRPLPDATSGSSETGVRLGRCPSSGAKWW